MRVVIGSSRESDSDGRVVNGMAGGDILVQGLKYNLSILATLALSMLTHGSKSCGIGRACAWDLDGCAAGGVDSTIAVTGTIRVLSGSGSQVGDEVGRDISLNG